MLTIASGGNYQFRPMVILPTINSLLPELTETDG
jgi:hypothetical protein